MHSNTQYLFPLLALLVLSTACQRDDGGEAQIAESEVDSGAIASAAAEAIAVSLRGSSLSDSAQRPRWILTPGPSSWDTLLIDELRRTEPSITDEAEDTTFVTTVSTHGFASRGDTVDVTVVIRSCAPRDTVFSFTKDSLVHRLVRATPDGKEWRQNGSVSHDHTVGECEAILPRGSPPPNG